jgi:diguanylate cyclase (GGDEF)-like protein/PAS domain S-box-containing protein
MVDVTRFPVGRLRYPISGVPRHRRWGRRTGDDVAAGSDPVSSSLLLSSRVRRAALGCAALAAVAAAGVLVGWVLHVEVLRRMVLGLSPMKANAAVSFLVGSLSLIAYVRSAPRSLSRRVAVVCAAVLVVVGAVTLAEYAFGVRLGIDELLFRDRDHPIGPYPGRPGANTALSFVLLGAALLAWDVRLGKWWPTNVLAGVAATLGLLALLGYATGAASVLDLTLRHHMVGDSMAALTVLLSSGVLLARLERGEIAVLASDGQAGAVLRRLLPAAILLPLSLALLTLAGERLELFSTSVGGWLFASAVTFGFAAVAWLVAAGSERGERERSRVELAARDAEERFRRAFHDAPIGMALISPDGRLEKVNLALGVICGRTRDELEGTRLRGLLHPADVDAGSEALRALASGDIEKLAVELRIIPAAGAPLTISVHGTSLRDGGGRPERLLCQFQDVTEHKRYEEQLRFMADHDSLTGLQNRRKFEAELDRHVAYVKRYGPGGALLVLDIDDFKSVNDTLGHSAGDELIVSIAGVMRARLRTSDVLARLGGDEFAALLPMADEAEAAQVAGELAKAVRSNTALLDGERKTVTASIGVAMFNTNVEELSGETVLIGADLAMYDAKQASGDGHAFYATSEHRDTRTKARLTWVNRIEQALEGDRFALLAQPILDLHTGEVAHHELLLRMLDDHDDLIPPASFLNIAERFGLIARLDEWVATRAIGLIEERPDLHLEVNISGTSLGDPRLLQALHERLRSTRIDPSHLICEVTETSAVANITHAQAFALHLRDQGCRFALDHFGAGFGSFYYLKHLPFDYVKIDGEFVQHAVTGHIDQLVIEAVVRIAQGLGKETIAEFVADEKTKRMVTRLGVDYAQGHHIGKPVPIAQLLETRSSPA